MAAARVGVLGWADLARVRFAAADVSRRRVAVERRHRRPDDLRIRDADLRLRQRAGGRGPRREVVLDPRAPGGDAPRRPRAHSPGRRVAARSHGDRPGPGARPSVRLDYTVGSGHGRRRDRGPGPRAARHGARRRQPDVDADRLVEVSRHFHSGSERHAAPGQHAGRRRRIRHRRRVPRPAAVESERGDHCRVAKRDDDGDDAPRRGRQARRLAARQGHRRPVGGGRQQIVLPVRRPAEARRRVLLHSEGSLREAEGDRARVRRARRVAAELVQRLVRLSAPAHGDVGVPGTAPTGSRWASPSIARNRRPSLP